MSVPMSKIVQERKEFLDPAPEGTHQGVLCGVSKEAYSVPNRFEPDKGDRIVVDLTFELKKPNPKGGNFYVREQYTASLNEKATLTKVLLALRGGVPISPEEIDEYKDVDAQGHAIWRLEDFLEEHVGMNALVGVKHTRDQRGNVYAHISNVIELPEGMPKIEPSPDCPS